MMIINKIRTALSSLKVKNSPEDLFIKRLRSLVIGEGMLHEGNIYQMNLAVKNMPENGVVLEIGSYGGLSTNLILYLLNKNNRAESVFNCDPWVYEGFKDRFGTKSTVIDGRNDITRDSYSKYMKESFIRGIGFLNGENLPYSFQLTSDAFFDQYDQNERITDIFERSIQLGAPISFAYIDGNHEYQYVKRDFENVDRYLMEMGFILFDDSLGGMQFGSALFMKEMKKNKGYQLINKNPNYLFQKINN